MAVAEGKKVPRLDGILDDGSVVKFADYAERSLVLYFYPKDQTPGCTNEAIAFRDAHALFRKHGCEILGVSRDSIASHAKFRAKYDLPFALLSDADERWCSAFGVLGEKKLYGRAFIGVIRSTFLIAPGGTIAKIWRNVRVPGHVDAVLECLPLK